MRSDDGQNPEESTKNLYCRIPHLATLGSPRWIDLGLRGIRRGGEARGGEARGGEGGQGEGMGGKGMEEEEEESPSTVSKAAPHHKGRGRTSYTRIENVKTVSD